MAEAEMGEPSSKQHEDEENDMDDAKLGSELQNALKPKPKRKLPAPLRKETGEQKFAFVC